MCLFYAGKHDVVIWYDCWPPRATPHCYDDVSRGNLHIAQDALLLNVTASVTRGIGAWSCPLWNWSHMPWDQDFGRSHYKTCCRILKPVSVSFLCSQCMSTEWEKTWHMHTVFYRLSVPEGLVHLLVRVPLHASFDNTGLSKHFEISENLVMHLKPAPHNSWILTKSYNTVSWF